MPEALPPMVRSLAHPDPRHRRDMAEWCIYAKTNLRPIDGGSNPLHPLDQIGATDD